MKIEIEPIKPHIGALVHIDRAALLDEAVAQQCLDALNTRDVLVFPRLGLSDAEQLAFTDRLGTRVNFTPNATSGGGDYSSTDIYKVTLDPENARPEAVLGTFFWHMDGMPVVTMPPPKATLLSARRLAPKGGQTQFASTRAAYAALSAAEREEIADLRALHSAAAGQRRVVENPEELQHRLQAGRSIGERPVVWRSKEGPVSMLIGETADYIVGMPLAEGRALLARLLEWSAQPDFVYSHDWQEGDFVLWNNCSALHRVIPYDRKSGRMMHRTSLAGAEMAV